MTLYTYTNSPEFISNLEFAYVETYSFQRGEEYGRVKTQLQGEWEKLQSCKDERINLTDLEETRLSELNTLLKQTQYLIDAKGQLHFSGKKTHTFKQDDPNINKIKQILLTEVKEIPNWLCAPIYRDAIVFYDTNNAIVDCLNICLYCEHAATKMFHHINCDITAYQLFKRFFMDIGHEIENS
ncbi:MAG: hypothetical protein JST86_14795 [Bacteroidetes bacterium]|nr:hypothetical protein [Bacteroidota bacterium]